MKKMIQVVDFNSNKGTSGGFENFGGMKVDFGSSLVHGIKYLILFGLPKHCHV